jgi:hypothetical protein
MDILIFLPEAMRAYSGSEPLSLLDEPFLSFIPPGPLPARRTYAPEALRGGTRKLRNILVIG